MKSLFSKLCLLSIVISSFFIYNQASAGHIGMMELTYRHITANTYEVTILLYRDCSGPSAPPPTTINVGASSASLGVSNGSAGTLTQLPTFGTGVPALKPLNMYNCSSAPLCHEEYVYRGNVNLNLLSATPNANDWIFYTSTCCYPPNLNNISAGTIWVEAGLNNLDFPGGNDSPFWHERRPNKPGHLNDVVINHPTTSLCVGKSVVLEQNAIDYEGDLIIHEISPVLSGSATPATYTNGFSPTVPLPFQTPPGFVIDSFTGEIPMIASTSTFNRFVVGILAKEFRNDTVFVGGLMSVVSKQVGYALRSLVVIVEPAATCPDTAIKMKDKRLQLACNDTAFTIEMTQKFECSTADADGSFLRITERLTSTPIAIDSVTVNTCFHDMIAEEFEVELAAPLGPGEYYVVMDQGNDGNTIISECGTEVKELRDTLLLVIDTAKIPELSGGLDSVNNPLSYIEAECGQLELSVAFTTPVFCNSIDTMGSDFTLIDSSGSTPQIVTVSKAEAWACTDGLASVVNLTLSQPLNPGRHSLVLGTGTDGNTVNNACGLSAPSFSIPVVVSDFAVDLGPDLQYCKDSTFMALLDAGSAADSYNWSTGDTVRQIIVTTKGTYTVQVFNEFGCTSTDAVVVTEIDCATGIAVNEGPQLKAFPVPAKEVLNVVLSGFSGAAELQLQDLTGKVWKTISVNGINNQLQRIDLENIPSGIYLLNLNQENSVLSTKKVLIQH